VQRETPVVKHLVERILVTPSQAWGVFSGEPPEIITDALPPHGR
jgi:hypothetical protein